MTGSAQHIILKTSDNPARRVRNPLPAHLRRKISGLVRIFIQIDRKTDAFMKETGLQCLPGCGECCHNKFVTASTLEMMPLAEELHRTGVLETWMAGVDRGNDQSPCIFFHALQPASHGYCRVYPFRPLVCRLFGFSARKNKAGQYELMVCGKIRQASPDKYEQSVDAAGKGKRSAPVSRDYIMKAYGLSPQLAGDADNINRAFYKAAETVLFYSHLFNQTTGREVNRVMANKNFPKNANKNKKAASAQAQAQAQAKGQPAQQKEKSGTCC